MQHSARIAKDYRMLLLRLQGGDFSGPKPFRFRQIWWETEGIKEVVEDAWKKSLCGSPTFRLAQKLIGLKHELRRWNKEEVSDIFFESRRLEGVIADFQAVDEEKRLSADQHDKLARYHNLLRQQELFWRQKSCISWLNKGDSNIKFFYRCTVMRGARDLIVELKDDQVDRT